MLILFVVLLLVVCVLGGAGVAAVLEFTLPEKVSHETRMLLSALISVPLFALFGGLCMELTIAAGYW